ncbi:GNAT family N-acetyltransferase [Streptomyces sp. ISL-90]|nr:GNAT family N-acetyltransferase [Streptomyces sp. ISL-90]
MRSGSESFRADASSRPGGDLRVIRTDRLRLVPYTPAHARRLLDGDPHDDSWAPGYPTADELDVARMYLGIIGPRGDPAPFGPYVIRLDGDGHAVGGFGFFGPPDDEGFVEFGYGLVESARGSGLATEAVVAALSTAAAHGALGARADTTPENLASQRVLEKAGLVEVRRDAASVVYETRR